MKGYLPHHRELQDLEDMRQRDEKLINLMATSLTILALVLLIWTVCYVGIGAVVKTTENQEKYYGKPDMVPLAPAALTYKKPAAYRLSSPTQAEMDHLHHMLQVMEVKK
jgi:hypothetical protein